MKDLGDAQKILGMNIMRDRKNFTLKLSQYSYVEKIINKFSMIDAKPSKVPLAAHFMLSKTQSPSTNSEISEMKNVPYSNAIGYAIYFMVCTRPDISYGFSCLSRYMSNPDMPHREALKWLMRYLKFIMNVGIKFSKHVKEVVLTGYVDSNYAPHRDNRKSNTCYVFTLCKSCIN